jgi:hypothetical protein
MRESARAVTNVLDLLKVLYDAANGVASELGSPLDALAAVGVDAADASEAELFLTIGLVVRLLLRHAGRDVEAMFASTRADLAALGQDLDDRAFAEITDRLDLGEQ